MKEKCKCGVHISGHIEPAILLLLRDKDTYGYEIIDKLNERPFLSINRVDVGTVYRELREMENEGLVKSKWATKGSGPARRIYTITKEGEERLDGWVVSLKKMKEGIEEFLKLYERR